MSKINIPKLYTTEKIAEILRLQKSTIYVWVYKNTIPHLKINGKLLFNEEDILNYIKTKTIQ